MNSEIYKSEEWRTINPLDRAQLLPVIEGLKKGTIIDANQTTALQILRKTGLDYHFNSDKYSLICQGRRHRGIAI